MSPVSTTREDSDQRRPPSFHALIISLILKRLVDDKMGGMFLPFDVHLHLGDVRPLLGFPELLPLGSDNRGNIAFSVLI